ncbi:hypothetical protein GUJ93_ZPchr0002g26145 [Zizania palustris]|uniref:UDP-glycosyltransferases domain-containing protein n=1 Tax=Zizania palustris TaxID=103762 RepID=A0A8J5SFY4_ZIZPA|nr:hypothetical protein GUJ93_ZPchr0002g26145 [Zizania palustris]
MKKTVVLYPGLAVSHFTPMIELADVFTEHGYAVAVALINPYVMGDDAAFTVVVRRAMTSKTSVSFHVLPRIPRPPLLPYRGNISEHIIDYVDIVRRYNAHLHDFLSSVKSLHAVVVDVTCGLAIEAARKLGVPVYQFYPFDAGALAVDLQIPSLRACSKRLGGDGTLLELLGVPPMPASHVTDKNGQPVGEKVDKDLEDLMAEGARATGEFGGILINTFVSLEKRALRALQDDLRRSLPDGKVLPPVYAVGPLVDKASAVDESSRHECLVWLDGQPDRSVVFLCFGSIAGAGDHPEQQLREIAAGLDKSGHRFLWVVRPPSTQPLDALLPEGFSARTRGRGLVVTNWVPQPEVLRHRATGAFVTHCGWNSVLEGITAGVPMLCWPMYAEQRINSVLVVEDMGVGVEMEGWLEGLVTADEVEAKVRLVMESEHGRKLGERVEAYKHGAAMAWKDGGSSRAAFALLLSEMDAAHDKRATAVLLQFTGWSATHPPSLSAYTLTQQICCHNFIAGRASLALYLGRMAGRAEVARVGSRDAGRGHAAQPRPGRAAGTTAGRRLARGMAPTRTVRRQSRCAVRLRLGGTAMSRTHWCAAMAPTRTHGVTAGRRRRAAASDNYDGRHLLRTGTGLKRAVLVMS